VIDDDEDFGLALTYFFADKPFQLFLAHTLSAGMALLQKELPDHVFLDNGLPDGLGWEQAAHIASSYPHIRLHLISSLGLPAPTVPVAVASILRKPIRLDDMLSCLA
jgi:DNA-binding response OmpR family regulator